VRISTHFSETFVHTVGYARHQDRQVQLVAKKEHRTAGPSPLLHRPAMEDLLTAPLRPRRVSGKMPQKCRIAYRSLLIELVWDLVNFNVEQPDAETAQAQEYGNIHMLTHAVARRLYPGRLA
jgi:hypothetical protein